MGTQELSVMGPQCNNKKNQTTICQNSLSSDTIGTGIISKTKHFLSKILKIKRKY